MATKTTERQEAEAAPEQQTDGPLLDLSDAGVRRMIKNAKRRGYVTYDELNEVLPPDQNTSDKIEDIYAMLNDMGINVVEPEEADDGQKEGEGGEEEEAEGTEVAEITPARAVALRPDAPAKEPTDRTDDPVRMYLREMGSVELLSREGEIAIAKRIEAGREAMIAGLCESPLTFQAIIIWRDELVEGKVLLRDIIDLEATYAGPDGKGGPKEGEEAEGDEDVEAEGPRPPEGDMDDDDMENNVSLSAMEAEIKPRVLEIFDNIAENYKKLRRLQVEHVEQRLQNKQLTPAQERKYKQLKNDVIKDVKSLSLNGARIEALVEQLYDINKRLISHEGKLMRLPSRMAWRATSSCSTTRAMSSTRNGSCACRSSAAGAGGSSSPTARTRSTTCARTSTRSRPRPASRSRSSGRSSPWSRRASAKPARPRRR